MKKATEKYQSLFSWVFNLCRGLFCNELFALAYIHFAGL